MAIAVSATKKIRLLLIPVGIIDSDEGNDKAIKQQ